VHTLKAGAAVSGLLVYCNPYRWAHVDRQMYPFARASTPTHAAIVPGNYRCFCVQPGETGNQVLAYRNVSIGLDGSKSLRVDVVLP
jgi:hypothetical protein